ncbi:MAG: hypothetical protein HY322_00180 [Betaproteobacteria bacterium]|nr:hypothetical protein [Betaproteobacteria bacterium]
MITAFNFYYAHVGQADAVLRQRLYASAVREQIGIPRGAVVARISGAADLPDVIWHQDFEDVAAHERDMDARAASAEFERVRAGMRKLIRRFERPLFENCDAAPSGDAEARPVVALDWIFCAAERASEALGALQDVARGCAARGFEPRRCLRLITTGVDLPALLWMRNYVDAAHAERERSQTAAHATSSALSGIADRVERSAWLVR